MEPSDSSAAGRQGNQARVHSAKIRELSMAGSSVLREKMYRAYLEFFEVAETKRRWNIFDDVPWEALDSSVGSERKAACIETFCAEELYLPDYSAGGVELSRSMFGAAWFQACWSYEESKHGLVFREYLTRSGLRSEAEFAALEERVFSRTWRLPSRPAARWPATARSRKPRPFSPTRRRRTRRRARATRCSRRSSFS
jgi:acyl-[acyl-carrier-protein] desaturase